MPPNLCGKLEAQILFKNSKCKTTNWIDISTGWFSTFFRKHPFFKRTWTKQPWIITLSGLTNSNYIKHTLNQQQSLQAIHFGDIKTYVQQSPPIWWRQIPGLLEFSCLNLKAPAKIEIVHVQSNKKTQVLNSPKNLLSSLFSGNKTSKISMKTSVNEVQDQSIQQQHNNIIINQ